MADFEFSGMNLKGLLDVLEVRGLREEIVSGLSAAAQAACAAPMARKWHPSAIAIEVWSAIIKQGGEQLQEDVNYEMTRKSFGPVVTPMVKVALALSGSSPAAVFSRLGQLSSLALRNVRFDWVSRDAFSGILTIRYPRSVPREIVEPAWRGIFRIGGELTGKDIRIERCVVLPEPGAYEFHVGW